MIEVLVSVFVLSVGLIGTGMIQLNAFRTTEQSGFHNTALALAMEIADEMRANDVQMRLPAGSNPFENFKYVADGNAPSSAITPNCYNEICSSAQWANHTKLEWQQKIYESLPGGQLQICRDVDVIDASGQHLQWCGSGASSSNSKAPVVVKIGWDEKDPSGALVKNQSPRVALLVSPYTK